MLVVGVADEFGAGAPDRFAEKLAIGFLPLSLGEMYPCVGFQDLFLLGLSVGTVEAHRLSAFSDRILSARMRVTSHSSMFSFSTMWVWEIST